MTDSKAMFGIFRTEARARATENTLKVAGFFGTDVHILLPKHGGSKDFPKAQWNRPGSGAIVGCAIGAVIGGLLGLLIYSGVLGPFGAEFSETVGVFWLIVLSCAVGSLLGTASGALVGIGTPEPAANRYASYIKAGGILLSVQVNDGEQATAAKKILEDAEAVDITLLAEGEGWAEATHSERKPKWVK